MVVSSESISIEPGRDSRIRTGGSPAACQHCPMSIDSTGVRGGPVTRCAASRSASNSSARCTVPMPTPSDSRSSVLGSQRSHRPACPARRERRLPSRRARCPRPRRCPTATPAPHPASRCEASDIPQAVRPPPGARPVVCGRAEARPPADTHPSGARPPQLLRKAIPSTVAIGRAGTPGQGRNLPRTEGHARGEDSLFDVIEGAIEIGLKYSSAYAFSTENWRRSPDEVRAG